MSLQQGLSGLPAQGMRPLDRGGNLMQLPGCQMEGGVGVHRASPSQTSSPGV